MTLDPKELTDFYAGQTLGAPDNAIGFVLWRLVHRFQREIDRAMAGIGLTHLQFTTLALVGWLNRSGEEASQVELARAGDIQPMQISHMLKVLETKGLVSRKSDSRNVRAKCAVVTPAGLSALEQAMPLAIEVQRRLFGDAGRPGGPLLEQLLAIARTEPRPMLAAQAAIARQRGGEPSVSED